MGTYLMALFVLGLEWGGLERSTDPQADETGTALEIADLPRRVRPKGGGRLSDDRRAGPGLGAG